MEGSEPVLGWDERDVRVDTVENEPLQYLSRAGQNPYLTTLATNYRYIFKM